MIREAAEDAVLKAEALERAEDAFDENDDNEEGILEAAEGGGDEEEEVDMDAGAVNKGRRGQERRG
jgi:hypothetical protein